MRIRPALQSDAEQLSHINATISQGGVINFASPEFSDSEKLLRELTFLDHLLVLESETEAGRVCGAVLLRVKPQIYLRRTAELRIIVAPEWQGQGLGKLLMKTALELADNELLLERVEVEIPTDNVNALKLCKSTGFKVEGIAKDWLSPAEGRYIDAYLLAHCKNVRQG